MSHGLGVDNRGLIVGRLLAPHVPEFAFLLDDIPAQTDEALRQRALGALPTLVLWALKHVRHEDDLIPAMRAVSDLMRAVYLAPRRVQALATVLRYIIKVSGTRSEEMTHFLQTDVHPMAHQTLITEAERLRREGHKEGHEEGQREGGQAVLRTLLQHRFGALPADALARIAAADGEQLDMWARRVLSASVLEEVFATASERP